MILSEKIQNQFEANPDLRVLFFFDGEKEYAEDVEKIEIPDVIVKNAAVSHFSLKIELEHKLSDKKVMLYFPYSRPEGTAKKSFILYDILLANKELYLDDLADFMNEFGLLPNQRPLVRRYIKDLKLKKHQKVLAQILNNQSFTDINVMKGLLSSYLEFPNIVDSTLLLSKLLILALPENKEKFNQFEKRLIDDDLKAVLISWLNQFMGVSTDKISREVLFSAVRKIKYNLLIQNIKNVKSEDPYTKLQIQDMFTKQRLNSLIVDWKNHPVLSEKLDLVFAQLGADIKEKSIIDIYGSEAEFTFYTTELKYYILAKSIESVDSQPDKVIQGVQELSGDPDEKKEIKLLMSFLDSAANMFSQINNISSYVLDTPQEYIETYIKDFSNIDTFYRKAIMSWESLRNLELPEEIQLDDLVEKIHQTYETYLIELNREWLKCLKQFDFKLNDISVVKQYQFYNQYIENSDQKLAVIISDALRFECAQELLGEVMVDTKGNAKMDTLLTGIPSVTKWGMANLLSNRQLAYVDEKITIDGISTEGTVNRKKILKLDIKDAVAIQYDKLMSMDRDKQRDVFKSRLVYIYHNVIDAIGDDRKTERKTFHAVTDAISELNSLVKKVHSSFNVSKVFITSDHGFLYNYRPLPESTFQDSPGGKHSETHNRYIITDDTKEINNSYLINLSDCSNVKSDLKVAIPKAVNRYKHKGSGSRFVHGGASLQEMIVPVIISTRKRVDIGSKVTFKLLNTDLRIVSGSIKIKIFQNDPVSSDTKPREIVLGIYNSTSQLVSNEIECSLNSPSQIPTDRTKEHIINLSSDSSQETILNLKAYDSDDDADRLNPLINEKIINSTLIESDF